MEDDRRVRAETRRPPVLRPGHHEPDRPSVDVALHRLEDRGDVVRAFDRQGEDELFLDPVLPEQHALQLRCVLRRRVRHGDQQRPR